MTVLHFQNVITARFNELFKFYKTVFYTLFKGMSLKILALENLLKIVPCVPPIDTKWALHASLYGTLA